MLQRIALSALVVVGLLLLVAGVIVVWLFAMNLLPESWQFPATLVMVLGIILALLDLAAVGQHRRQTPPTEPSE